MGSCGSNARLQPGRLYTDHVKYSGDFKGVTNISPTDGMIVYSLKQTKKCLQEAISVFE